MHRNLHQLPKVLVLKPSHKLLRLTPLATGLEMIYLQAALKSAKLGCHLVIDNLMGLNVITN